MNILLLGSGAREHAIASKIAESLLLSTLYIAPGNCGMSGCGTIVTLEITQHQAVIDFCLSENIGLVIVGAEQPLVAGIADDLRAAGILVFGPNKNAAQLEASKEFTKQLCYDYQIPTARYAAFGDAESALSYINDDKIVIKADGLAAGKGVIIAENRSEAEEAIREIFSGKFGSSGKRIVIEEFMKGYEVSFFAICDGEKAVYFGSASDYKKAFDGNKGPNTGGMGSFSPAYGMDDAMVETVMATIIDPTIKAMKKRGTPFSGVLFAGLMMTDAGPKLMEYNVRFGDPETQSLLARLDEDLLAILLSAANGSLAESFLLSDSAVCLVLASNGYPDKPIYGDEINLSSIEIIDGVKIFHAGTKIVNDKLTVAGGRVLSIVARSNSLIDAREKAYRVASQAIWPSGFYRNDIASSVIGKQ